MPHLRDVEDDDASDDGCEWMLGFVDQAEKPTDLLRHRFPSKVGGRPAWLNPRDLPTREQLTCSASGKQMRFLMQVYAPPPEEEIENTDAFHRAIFLFVSPEGNTLSQPGAVRALRCQLPRSNPFYPYDPPSASDKFPLPLPAEASLGQGRDPWQVAEAEAAMAAGTSGRGSSSSRGRGGAKGSSQAAAASLPADMHLFPELELLVEAEADVEEYEPDDQVQRLVQQYQEQVAKEGEVSQEELPPEVLEQVEAGVSKDRQHFAMFQAALAAAPDQCLRYCFSEAASPLCPGPEGIPSASDVPPCSRCGGPRVFELQVMPQLLNYLDLDEEDPHALDWGTIAVYSCKASCPITPAATSEPEACSAYAEEFVWVQPS